MRLHIIVRAPDSAPARQRVARAVPTPGNTPGRLLRCRNRLRGTTEAPLDPTDSVMFILAGFQGNVELASRCHGENRGDLFQLLRIFRELGKRTTSRAKD